MGITGSQSLLFARSAWYSRAETIFYQEPASFVFGSFNHTRKITSDHSSVLEPYYLPIPKLFFSFEVIPFMTRQSVEFLSVFCDAGIDSHQLQPFLMLHRAAEAMSDYGRIHLHLDSYPVSGTTTTLDSLAMGIPVLTCPTNLYAGAISSSILEHAGLEDHICH